MCIMCWGVKLCHLLPLHSVVGLEGDSKIYQEPRVLTTNQGHGGQVSFNEVLSTSYQRESVTAAFAIRADTGSAASS